MSNIYLTLQQNKDTKYNVKLHRFSQRSDRNKGRKLLPYRSQLICDKICFFVGNMEIF
jgi:hypothetical protein